MALTMCRYQTIAITKSPNLELVAHPFNQAGWFLSHILALMLFCQACTSDLLVEIVFWNDCIFKKTVGDNVWVLKRRLSERK